VGLYDPSEGTSSSESLLSPSSLAGLLGEDMDPPSWGVLNGEYAASSNTVSTCVSTPSEDLLEGIGNPPDDCGLGRAETETNLCDFHKKLQKHSNFATEFSDSNWFIYISRLFCLCSKKSRLNPPKKFLGGNGGSAVTVPLARIASFNPRKSLYLRNLKPRVKKQQKFHQILTPPTAKIYLEFERHIQ